MRRCLGDNVVLLWQGQYGLNRPSASHSEQILAKFLTLALHYEFGFWHLNPGARHTRQHLG